MFKLECGRHNNGKWVSDMSFERDSIEDARSGLLEISNDMKNDPDFYTEFNIQTKVIDLNNKVLHYITVNMPGIWIGSEFSR